MPDSGRPGPVTLPYNQAMIDKLAKALASGIRTVEYDGRSVGFVSHAQMQQTLDRMIRTVNNQGDGALPPNTRGSVFIAR